MGAGRGRRSLISLGTRPPATHRGVPRTIRSLGIALFALAFGAASAGAVVVEIPLPALHGTYGPWSVGNFRTVAFALPQPPSVVRAVSLRLRGSTQVGRISCDFGTPAERDWHSTFASEMIDSAPGAGWTTGYCPAVPSGGEFECTLAYDGYFFPPYSPPTWAFLADGQGELTLVLADQNALMCAELTEFPIGVIEEATLIVDMDFAVPALPRSWGQIKVAYR